MLTALITRKFDKVLRKAEARRGIRAGEQWFVARGQTRDAHQLRRKLVRDFRHVNEHVKCAHSDVEILRMADFFLNSQNNSPIVECGCFRGGATAKLSLVARATRRRIIVCDSFAGLPVPADIDRGLTTLQDTPYECGMFAGTLDDVRASVTAFGAIEACDFRQGYFESTLPNMPECEISGAFVDVDLISSARDCLAALWPRLSVGGRLFVHEARDLQLVRGITDADWWQSTHRQSPPVLIGAGFGCGDAAPQLAYFDKTHDKRLAG